MERTRKPFISILTATYNRAEYLKRTYLSILANSKFGEKIEWLIMDDGSTDNTREVVEKMVGNENLSINYYYQKNMGKMAAINHLTRIATGEYMMDLDSDDMLSENAIEIIKSNVFEVPLTYGFVFLKAYPDGKIMGEKFKNREYNRTMFEVSFKECIDGEKCIVFISSVRKEYEHKLEDDEKFVTEARLYHEMDKTNTVFVFNEVVQLCEYQQDGYTKNINKMLYSYPKGYYMYFKELLEFDFKQVSMKKRMYILKHYILYSYLTGKGLDLSTVYNFMNKVLLVLLYLPGIIKTKTMLKNNREIADIYYSNKHNYRNENRKNNKIKDYISEKLSKSSKYIVDEEIEENIKGMNNLGINISNVDNVFTTNTNLGVEVVDKNNKTINGYNINDSDVEIYESNESYQKIYNEETRKEVKRSQKLKDKLDELINRSRNKKE